MSAVLLLVIVIVVVVVIVVIVVIVIIVVLGSESVSCISNGASNNPTEAIGRCFKDLMHQDSDIIEQQLTKLILSIKQAGIHTIHTLHTHQ